MPEQPQSNSEEFLKSKTLVIAKQATSFLGGTVFFSIVGFIFNVYVARTMGAELLGEFSLVLAIIMVITGISKLGFSVTLLKFVPEYLANRRFDHLKGLLRNSIGYTTLCSLLLVVILIMNRDWIAGSLFNKPELASVILSLAPLLPIVTLFNIGLFVIRGMQKVDMQVFVQKFLLTILKFAIVAPLFYLGWRLQARIQAETLSIAICTIVVFVYIYRKAYQPYRGIRAVFDRSAVWRYTRPMLMINILTAINSHVDRLFIGAYNPEADVAIFSMALRLSFFVSIFLESLSSIFAPIASEAVARNHIQDLGTLYSSITKWSILCTLPLVVVIFFYASTFLSVFGEEFKAGGPAFVMLSLGYLVIAAVGPAGAILLMAGQEKSEMWNYFVNTMLSLPLFFLMVPRWGIEGAALVNTITLAVVNLFKLYLVRTRIKISPFTRKFIHFIPSLLLSILFVYLLNHYVHLNDFAQLLLGSVISYATFGLMYLKFGLDDDDKSILDRVKKSLNKSGRET